MTSTHLPLSLALAILDAHQKKRIQLMIFLVITVVGIGQTIVYALLAPVGRQIGMSELQIGTIMTCASIAYAITTPLWGIQSGRRGRKSIMLVGLVGYGAGTLIFTIVLHAGLLSWLMGIPVFLSLVLTRVLLCMLMSAATPAATAYITEITTVEERTSGMSIIATAQAIGSVLGPGFALLAGVHLLLPLYLLSALTLILAVVVVWALPHIAPITLSSNTSANNHLGIGTLTDNILTKREKPERIRLPGRELWPYCVLGTGAFAAFSLVQVCLAYHFQDALQLSTAATAQKVGMAMMATAVGALLAQVLFVRKLAWPSQRLLIVGLSAMAIGFAGVGGTSLYWMAALSMGVTGVGLGMTIPAYMALASLAGGEQHRDMVAGIISACPAVGFIIGPLAGSMLYTVHAALPFMVAVVLCGLLAVYGVIISRRL